MLAETSISNKTRIRSGSPFTAQFWWTAKPREIVRDCLDAHRQRQARIALNCLNLNHSIGIIRQSHVDRDLGICGQNVVEDILAQDRAIERGGSHPESNKPRACYLHRREFRGHTTWYRRGIGRLRRITISLR